MAEPEWHSYRCSVPAAGKKNWHKGDCSILDKVYHIAHVPDACRILEDGEIKARLIGDESRLRKTRTSVSWVSANSWAYGSIYGNVQFEFRWQDLIKDKRAYWVEAMTGYKPTAYRYLITDRNLDESKHVQHYDPEVDKGPLRLRSGTWYCNVENLTSEFMLDMNIPLSKCCSVQFVRHHPSICRLHGSSCRDRTLSPDSAGAQVLAYVIGRRLGRTRHCFLRQSADGTKKPGFTIRDGLQHLFEDLNDGVSGVINSSERSRKVLRGALLLYGAGQEDDARDLATVLGSPTVLKKGLEHLARQYLRLDEFTLAD